MADAGLSPATATQIEGMTSTRVGDVVEVQSMAAVLEEFFNLPSGSIALGSVKSNIGHLKGAAGAAGILKTAMALHHMLPPAARFEHPNRRIQLWRLPALREYDVRPWTTPSGGVRRAGVSAFGFGGANFHAVLEQYRPGGAERASQRGILRLAAVGRPLPGGAGTTPRGGQIWVNLEPGELAGRVARFRKAAAKGHVPAPHSQSELQAAERLVIDYNGGDDLAEKKAGRR